MFGANIDDTNKITASLLVAGKQGGPEVNAEKSQCMVMSCRTGGSRRSRYTKTVNGSFENRAKFRYLGLKLRNHN